MRSAAASAVFAISSFLLTGPAAAAPAPAPFPAPLHAFTPFDDVELLAASVDAQLDKRVAVSGGLRIGFKEKHGQFGGAAKRFTKRQAADDESELGNFGDIRYIATITIAGQELDVILDTGSTDTFVYTSQPEPFEGVPADQVPPLFDNSTRPGLYSTGIPYEARYGSGNGITTTRGNVQLADVYMNGTDIGDGTPLAVANLSFAALYESSSATGASGLLGLGFPLNGIVWPSVISSYYNETGEALSPDQSARFYPIVPLLHHEGRIPRNLFSVEVDRDPADAPPPTGFVYTAGGTLTLGDFPEGTQESDFTWSPVPVVEFNEVGVSRGLPKATGNRWTLELQGIYFNGARLQDTEEGSAGTDGKQYLLVDTGNPSTGLPQDVLLRITNAYAANPSNAFVACDAPFELAFQFGGKNFTMNRANFLVPSSEALDSVQLGGSTNSGCQVQIQPGEVSPEEFGKGTHISGTLGTPFLRSVFSVFDYGDLTNAISSPPRIGLAQRTQ